MAETLSCNSSESSLNFVSFRGIVHRIFPQTHYYSLELEQCISVCCIKDKRKHISTSQFAIWHCLMQVHLVWKWKEWICVELHAMYFNEWILCSICAAEVLGIQKSCGATKSLHDTVWDSHVTSNFRVRTIFRTFYSWPGCLFCVAENLWVENFRLGWQENRVKF